MKIKKTYFSKFTHCYRALATPNIIIYIYKCIWNCMKILAVWSSTWLGVTHGITGLVPHQQGHQKSTWMFPKIGGKPPKWMVKILENPMNKWMIWEFSHYFWKHPHQTLLEARIICNIVISCNVMVDDYRLIKFRRMIYRSNCGWSAAFPWGSHWSS